jgi:hypothetical protein
MGREGKYGEAYLIHQVDGVVTRPRSRRCGDYQKPTDNGQPLTAVEKLDFIPRPDDSLQSAFTIHGHAKRRVREEYEFRS